MWNDGTVVDLCMSDLPWTAVIISYVVVISKINGICMFCFFVFSWSSFLFSGMLVRTMFSMNWLLFCNFVR